jgi:S-ribosylhomocysteine lyase
MQRITSFTVDHDYITPGMYISRIDGDVTTFDLRTRRPNAGDYMDNLTMHSVEHMLATLLRNGPHADSVIYFGPMGCQTGFYLLTRSLAPEVVYDEVVRVLQETLAYIGKMPGESQKECGNYRNLSMEAAKVECERYLTALLARGADFTYPKGETL